MSILLAVLNPTSAPVTPPPVVPQTTQGLSLPLLMAMLVWLIIVLFLSRRLGVFRRNSVTGPERLEPDESGWVLLGILLTGFFVANFIAVGMASFARVNVSSKALLLTAVVETLAFPIIVAASAWIRQNGIARLGLRLQLIPRGILIGALTLFTLFPAVFAAEAISEIVIHTAGLPEPKPHEVLQDLTSSKDPRLIVLAVGVAVLVAPFFEELAFRGFLQTILGRLFAWIADRSEGEEMLIPDGAVDPMQLLPRAMETTERKMPTVGPGPRWLAIVITAAAFAAIHGVPAFFPPLFVLAVILGYAYERTGNLWVTITAHALFNTCQIVFYLQAQHV